MQDGIRISERLQLSIREGRIEGTGTDKDGDFEVSGFYTSRNEQVMITRRYTRTSDPSQADVGVPFDYQGIWDGSMVHGTWHSRSYPMLNGFFEMWPDREEDREELQIDTNVVEMVVSSVRGSSISRCQAG